jgi:hypothetical protein
MHVCTIVARNYLAAARVLARSFRAHNPDGTCWTLVIDDVSGEIGAGEPFEVVHPADLDIDSWDEMAAGYGVLELSTAVKPWLLRHLLTKAGVERITYLDPDIQVFDSLDEVEQLLASHAVVVNPHLTAPMPRDDRRPAETDILLSGSFNLGFGGFAHGPEVDELLTWWSERLARDCLVAPERGYFVDQRWMDLAPGLIPTLAVLRDPGYNVAYWNLSGRDVRRDGERYIVNDRPLRFFHFSGYDPDHPDQLSKHQDRIDLNAHPAVRELCDSYARALADEGHAAWRRRPYAWGALPDGTPLDAAARAVYRAGAQDGALSDGSIYAEPGASSFLRYLRGPAEHGGKRGVSRYLEALHASRRDLLDAFVDLDSPDGGRLLAWAELSSNDIPLGLLVDGGADAVTRPGVNAAGYFQGVMGVGEHGRQLVTALQTQGIPVTLTTLHPEAAPEDLTLPGGEGPGAPTTAAYFNLLCANAESVPGVARALGPNYFGDRYTVGFWAWEVSAFPERYMSAFAHLDEVWVGSRHVRDAIAELAPVPVLAIPQPVSLPDGFASAAPPSGLPTGFRFVFAFDYLSVFERKNALGTVRAFSQAFAPGSGAVLIVKTLNAEYDPDAHARLQAAIAGHPDIHLLERRLSHSERDGLMNATDCYVSLHRAEGFGYTMAESMWAGKPVIATAYSGNLDYMTKENSYPVDFRLVPIGPGHAPYPAHGVWADPDLEHAARLMREVFEHRDDAARRGARGAESIRRTHSPEAAGRFMTERLRRILGSSRWRAARGSGPIRTEWVSDLIRSGPVPPGAGHRFGAAQRLARQGLLRVLKPVTVHERLVAGELLTAIEKLDANLDSLTQAHAVALRRIDELRAEVRDLQSDQPAAIAAQEDESTEQRSGRS